MSTTADRAFTAVADRLAWWRAEEEPAIGLDRARRELWQLLRDYRAGLVADEAAEDGLHQIGMQLYAWGMIRGIYIAQGHPG